MANEFINWTTRVLESMSNRDFNKVRGAIHKIHELADDINRGKLTLGQAEDKFLALLQ